MSVETEAVDTAVDTGADSFGASDAGTESSGSNIAAVAADMGVPDEIIKDFVDNDPDFANIVNSQSADKGDNSGSEDYGDWSNVKASVEDAAPDRETEDHKSDSADEKIPATKEGGSGEFADNVIPGLAGRDIAKLPDDAKVALANFYNEAQAKAAKAEEEAARIDQLMQDPVVAARAAAIEAGRAADLQVRGMTPTEHQKIAAHIADKLGLDSQEVQDALSTLGSGLEAVARDMAQDIANKTIAAQDFVRRQEEVTKQGNDLLLGLSEFNKELTVAEKDLANFYKVQNGDIVYNDSHPEIEKFKNGIGKISAWAGENGIDYGKALKMGKKALYAAAAAALDMPIAFNTKTRDAKIAAAAKQKALSPFLKSSQSNTLNAQGTDSTVNRERAGRIVRDGVDIARLVTDSDYYNSVVERKFGDSDWLNKVDGWAAEGRKTLNN